MFFLAKWPSRSHPRPTSTLQLLRSAAEWRRWEHVAAGGAWVEHKRRAWAEELLESQRRRRWERERLRWVLGAAGAWSRVLP